MSGPLREIRWPRAPFLVVVDPGQRTLVRYHERTMVGGWELGETELSRELVEEVRVAGAGKDKGVQPKEVA